MILNLVCYSTLFQYCVPPLDCGSFSLCPDPQTLNLKLTSSCSHAILSYRYRFPKYFCSRVQLETFWDWAILDRTVHSSCGRVTGSKGIGNYDIFYGVDYLWWVLDGPNRKCTNNFLWEWHQNLVMSTLEGYMNLQMRSFYKNEMC